MKKYLILLSFIALLGTATAISKEKSCCSSNVVDTIDNDTIQTDIIQRAIAATITMCDAAAIGDSATLKQSAQEIAQLDLSSIDMVVLLACDTALGDVSSSEDLFGLQRGFKKAGAK